MPDELPPDVPEIVERGPLVAEVKPPKVKRQRKKKYDFLKEDACSPVEKKVADVILEDISKGKKPVLAKIAREVSAQFQTTVTPAKVKNISRRANVQRYFEACGLDEKFFGDALREDIEKKPQNRLGELRLLADVMGFTESEKKKEAPPQAVQIDKALFVMREIVGAPDDAPTDAVPSDDDELEIPYLDRDARTEEAADDDQV